MFFKKKFDSRSTIFENLEDDFGIEIEISSAHLYFNLFSYPITDDYVYSIVGTGIASAQFDD
ncbi:hypothetical protein BpHYR1_015492 [Brachionus plicatilis]|uniref:Uncharacterized protein n=1 Tax=Brachionus plicatilis TaxID=10195 RepID=A0A3M7T0G3_BRAPC|nr:hypothetical protein BpHYR1_015492 [Brachionus plicatilis]